MKPEGRSKVTTLDYLNTAVNYAETFSGGIPLEVVDERTGLLKATVANGEVERTWGAVRREIL